MINQGNCRPHMWRTKLDPTHHGRVLPLCCLWQRQVLWVRIQSGLLVVQSYWPQPSEAQLTPGHGLPNRSLFLITSLYLGFQWLLDRLTYLIILQRRNCFKAFGVTWWLDIWFYIIYWAKCSISRQIRDIHIIHLMVCLEIWQKSQENCRDMMYHAHIFHLWCELV